MSSVSYSERSRPAGLPLGKQMVIRVIAVVLVCVGAAAYLFLREHNSDTSVTPLNLTSDGVHAQSNAMRVVSDLEIPAVVLLHIGTVDSMRAAGSGADTSMLLNQPSDFVPLRDRYYALDGGNSRIVELDASGRFVSALDKSLDQRLALHNPMAMALHDGKLFVADSEASRIVIVNPTARAVEKDIALPKIDADERMPRPIGIVIASGGKILVSDANNHRVIKLSEDGTAESFAGTGKRDSGNRGLNTPGGLAVDSGGNVYVVDILNGRVVKYSSDGKYLQQFGKPGDTAGAFARPKGVAVDERGNVFVSDSLQAAVEGFDSTGKYIGLVGRQEPGNRDSMSVFEAPAEMKLVENRLYVTDRLAGPFVFELGGKP